MHRPIPHPLAVAIFAGMLQLPAQAALNAVDPGAYIPANGGFPAWYQDSHGRTLDLCLTKAVSLQGRRRARRTVVHVHTAAHARCVRRYPTYCLPHQLP